MVTCQAKGEGREMTATLRMLPPLLPAGVAASAHDAPRTVFEHAALGLTALRLHTTAAALLSRSEAQILMLRRALCCSLTQALPGRC